MKIKLLSPLTVPLALLLSVGAVCCVALRAQTPATTTGPTLAQLSWMSGGWRTAPGGRVQIEEHWMAPAGSSMLGMSRTVSGDRTVEFEYVRVEQRTDGLYYVAHPGARSPGTDFKLTSHSATEAVFENPAHDFPKRIIYRKNSDGSLTASVDGGEKTKPQTFAYIPIAK